MSRTKDTIYFRLLPLWRTGLRLQVLLGSAVLTLVWWLLVFRPGGNDPLGLLKSSGPHQNICSGTKDLPLDSFSRVLRLSPSSKLKSFSGCCWCEFDVSPETFS